MLMPLLQLHYLFCYHCMVNLLFWLLRCITQWMLMLCFFSFLKWEILSASLFLIFYLLGPCQHQLACNFISYLQVFLCPFVFLLWQVDLFFYREPEEVKPPEEEDVVAPVDYALTGPDYMGGAADSWSTPVADSGWTNEALPIPAAPVTTSWTPDQGMKCVCFVD